MHSYKKQKATIVGLLSIVLACTAVRVPPLKSINEKFLNWMNYTPKSSNRSELDKFYYDYLEEKTNLPEEILDYSTRAMRVKASLFSTNGYGVKYDHLSVPCPIYTDSSSLNNSKGMFHCVKFLPTLFFISSLNSSLLNGQSISQHTICSGAKLNPFLGEDAELGEQKVRTLISSEGNLTNEKPSQEKSNYGKSTTEKETDLLVMYNSFLKEEEEEQGSLSAEALGRVNEKLIKLIGNYGNQQQIDMLAAENLLKMTVERELEVNNNLLSLSETNKGIISDIQTLDFDFKKRILKEKELQKGFEHLDKTLKNLEHKLQAFKACKELHNELLKRKINDSDKINQLVSYLNVNMDTVIPGRVFSISQTV